MTAEAVPVDPSQLHQSAAFAQGMIVPAGPTLYVGGQNGTDANGELLDGIEAQSRQAMRNVLAVLETAGAGPEQVAKLTIHLAPEVDPQVAYEATAAVWDRRTAVTVLAAAPARPGALVEIEAVATLAKD